MSRLVLLMLLASVSIQTVKAQKQKITAAIPRAESESHIYFLASDEMRGRKPGTSEIDIAARYIAEQFRKAGVKPLTSDGSYFQQVPMTFTAPPKETEVDLLGKKYSVKRDLIVLNGPDISITAPVVVLPSSAEIEKADLKGKIVVSLSGEPNRLQNAKLIARKGGLAWLRVYQFKQWRNFHRYMKAGHFSQGTLKEHTSLPIITLQDTLKTVISDLSKLENQKAQIHIKGVTMQERSSYNVVGRVEGMDAKMKNEHIVLSAHYDHLGIGTPSENDSIYNGTRDNAIGTTGLINAAKYFSQRPAKRSMLFIAFTAEELGFFGSQYYVDNPLVPLQQCAYNLNIDNAGYNDTGKITIIGNGRTSADELIRSSAKAFGLEAINDPLPKENFVERSDNVKFMEKGVPSMQYAMGLTAMDEKVTKYYHKPEDEVKNVDLDYVYKYLCSYILAAEKLGNWNQQPTWTKGDKFEKAGEQLYRRKSEPSGNRINIKASN